MLFDVNAISQDRKEKIAKGALKYIAIKESFDMNITLQENEIFKKWFMDFYQLKESFKTPAMQLVFYELFQSIRELYNGRESQSTDNSIVYKYICTIISRVAGRTEKSFSSKILHTLNADSPIIDSNVLDELKISKDPQTVNDAVVIYNNLLSEYTKNGGLLDSASQAKWFNAFDDLCKSWIIEILKNGYYEQKKRIKSILKDICKAIKLKESTNKIEQLESELEIEKFFEQKIKRETLLDDINNKFGIDIMNLIENISNVKKIDFCLWAKNSK